MLSDAKIAYKLYVMKHVSQNNADIHSLTVIAMLQSVAFYFTLGLACLTASCFLFLSDVLLSKIEYWLPAGTQASFGCDEPMIPVLKHALALAAT